MSKTTRRNWGGARNGSGRKFQSLKLSHAEAMLITDALNGIIIDRDNAAAQLPLEIADAIRLRKLDTKWDVDAAILLRKLERMTPQTTQDLADSVTKFWTSIR